MTEENKTLRETLKTAESIVVQCLHSQPTEDESCRIHLLKALEKLANLVGQYHRKEELHGK